MDNHHLLYYLGGVPVLGILAQWIAWRLKLPSILLLLVFGALLGFGMTWLSDNGMLHGSHGAEHHADQPAGSAHGASGAHQAGAVDGAAVDGGAVDGGAVDGVVEKNSAAVGDWQPIKDNLLFPAISLAVAVIMFEGGLTLRFSELKQAGGVVLRLCTIAVLVSWVLTALAAMLLLNFDVRIAALIGAVLVVTGPTVIAPLLHHIQPQPKISSIVKWEGIVVDPIGAILAVLMYQVISGLGSPSVWSVASPVIITVVVGGLLGALAGFVMTTLFRRYMVPDFLQGVVVLSTALGLFALSDFFQRESGLVTVTVFGVYLANQKSVSMRHVVQFKEHLVVLLISCLFIVLGSRIQLAEFIDLGFSGIAFVVALIVVVRPASIFIATAWSGLNWREKTFLAFMAPRGIVAAAVSSIFALEIMQLVSRHEQLMPLAEDAARLGPLTFLVITGTVGIYGLAAAPVARMLKLADPDPQGLLIAGGSEWIRDIAAAVHKAGIQVHLVDTNFPNVSAARMEGLPADCVSILSEHLEEDLQVSGIGRLLAMTGNDQVNSLAVREYTHHFGRENVYQLTPWDAGSGPRESTPAHLRGRLLFNDSLTYHTLENQLESEPQLVSVTSTQLSEKFDYDAFVEHYDGHATVLFTIDDKRKLAIATHDEPLAPVAGQTVIALVPFKDPAAKAIENAADDDDDYDEVEEDEVEEDHDDDVRDEADHDDDVQDEADQAAGGGS